MSGIENTAQTGSILTQQYLHASCSIRSMNGDLLAIGVLYRVEKDYIEIRNPEDKLPLIPYNSSVRISVIGDDLPPYFGVGRTYVSSSKLVRLVDCADVMSFERREAFRVTVRESGKMYPMREKQPNGEDADYSDLEPIAISMRDLSLTGIYFYCAQRLSIGQHFHAVLPLDRVTFETDFEVVRIVDDQGKIGYGGRFAPMNRWRSDQLCAYLYRKQGEQIRRVKSLTT